MNYSSFSYSDPLVGDLDFTDLEVKILENKNLRRLRHISQNSFLYFVFPGAFHTRFEHSVGVMNISYRLYKNIYKTIYNSDPNKKECQEFRIAALLHDIGHGPFSHISEYLFDRFNLDKPKFNELNQNHPYHELKTYEKIITCKENAPDLFDLLKDFDISRIARWSIGEHVDGEYDYWKPEIIHSDFDADRMDYLLRDSYFTGVAYGAIDLARLISEKTFKAEYTESPGKKRRLVIDYKNGLGPAESLLLARGQMYPMVYLHSTGRAAAAMFYRAFDILFEKDNERCSKIINNIMGLEDIEALRYLTGMEETRDIAERLLFRRLFKKFSFKFLEWRQLHPDVKNVFEDINKDAFQLREWERNIEREICKEECDWNENGIPPIIVDIPSMKSLKESKALVYDNNFSRLLEVSPVGRFLQEISTTKWNLCVFKDPESPVVKEKLVRTDIDERIKKYFTEGIAADLKPK